MVLKVKGSKAYNIKIDGFTEPLEPVLKRALIRKFSQGHYGMNS